MHISDFHVGMAGASNLWVQVKERLHQDVRRHIEEVGNIDLVVFSGDITQKSAAEEFEAAFSELVELWEVFESAGCCPKLFIVPGNHDLNRVKAEGSALLSALDAWRKRASNAVSLLGKAEHSYRKETFEQFSEYLKFIERLKQSVIPVLCDTVGALPGDCSGVLEVNGLKIGVVGLNTAWSQLENSKKEGDLEFSADQIHHAVEGEITKWISSNNLNFLVTHHPVSWLVPDARTDFINEVNPLGRFDAHLFGHMHEHRAVGQEYSQNARKRDIQVASLFGLEKAADGKIDRAHGYYFASVSPEVSELRIWPRSAQQVTGGGWRVYEDRYSLPEGGLFSTHALVVRNYNAESQKKKT